MIAVVAWIAKQERLRIPERVTAALNRVEKKALVPVARLDALGDS
jgi:hypothetical protein